MARVREARLKNGEKGPPSGIQIFLQGALAKLGATLVRSLCGPNGISVT